LGSFLVAQFQLAAMQRANTGEEERRDFHLYIDEFQNFTTDSFRSILSEARKYRLCLALGHQYISQLPESLRSAVFGNVGTMIALRVGYEDAEILAAHFTGGDTLIQNSRDRFATRRGVMEEKINQWMRH
jgi:type IV secretory pathway TraG/TraD family ATPase VirD4